MFVKSRVFVDEREKASGVPDRLRELGLMVDYRMLEVGDYILPRCAIERKERLDFVRSLYSGRIFDQASRLSEAYDNPVLIVEGDIASMIGSEIKARAYWGILAALAFDHGFKVFFSSDTSQTADIIYTLVKRRPRKIKGPVIIKKPKSDDTEKMQLQMVSTLPGIGLKLADRLLRDFETVRKVFAASAAELSTVKGVGRVRAQRIAEVMDAPYHPFAKRPQQLRLSEADPKDLKA